MGAKTVSSPQAVCLLGSLLFKYPQETPFNREAARADAAGVKYDMDTACHGDRSRLLRTLEALVWRRRPASFCGGTGVFRVGPQVSCYLRNVGRRAMKERLVMSDHR